MKQKRVHYALLYNVNKISIRRCLFHGAGKCTKNDKYIFHPTSALKKFNLRQVVKLSDWFGESTSRLEEFVG